MPSQPRFAPPPIQGLVPSTNSGQLYVVDHGSVIVCASTVEQNTTMTPTISKNNVFFMVCSSASRNGFACLIRIATFASRIISGNSEIVRLAFGQIKHLKCRDESNIDGGAVDARRRPHVHFVASQIAFGIGVPRQCGFC